MIEPLSATKLNQTKFKRFQYNFLSISDTSKLSYQYETTIQNYYNTTFYEPLYNKKKN